MNTQSAQAARYEGEKAAQGLLSCTETGRLTETAAQVLAARLVQPDGPEQAEVSRARVEGALQALLGAFLAQRDKEEHLEGELDRAKEALGEIGDTVRYRFARKA